MIFGKRPAQAPSRAQILKRGLIGIAVVLVLAFIASFLGGGSDAPAPKDQQAQGDQKPTAQQSNSQSEDEGSAIDAKDLLGAEPDAPSSDGGDRVPASRKFDYSAGMDDDQGAQDGALEPPKGTAPAAEPMAQPAPGQSPWPSPRLARPAEPRAAMARPCRCRMPRDRFPRLPRHKARTGP